MRKEPFSREHCVVNEHLLAQTVLKLTLHNVEGSRMARWLKGRREEL